MTDTQLYLVIGVPVLVNTGMLALLLMHLDSRFGSVGRRFDAINQRFNDMRDLWRAELHRVEEVLEARRKHIEAERR